MSVSGSGTHMVLTLICIPCAPPQHWLEDGSGFMVGWHDYLFQDDGHLSGSKEKPRRCFLPASLSASFSAHPKLEKCFRHIKTKQHFEIENHDILCFCFIFTFGFN